MNEYTWQEIQTFVAQQPLDTSLSVIITEIRQSVTAIQVWTRTAELSCVACDESKEAFQEIDKI